MKGPWAGARSWQMPGDLWRKLLNGGCCTIHAGRIPQEALVHGSLLRGNFDESLQWQLPQWSTDQGVQKCVADLGTRCETSISHMRFRVDRSPTGTARSATFVAVKDPCDYLVVCNNFTPVVRQNDRLGVRKRCGSTRSSNWP